MEKIIQILSDKTSEISDDMVVLMARDVSWVPQIDDGTGNMIDNPVEDWVAQAILNTINQWALNTQKADDEKEITDTITEMREQKEQTRQTMMSAITSDNIKISK